MQIGQYYESRKRAFVLVKNIKGENVYDNQINDFHKSVFHGDVMIGSMTKSPKKLSDCEKQEVPEKALRNSIHTELIAGAISLLISFVSGFLDKVIPSGQDSAIIIIFVAFICLIALLIAVVLLFSGISKLILLKRLTSSSEFIEMPSTVFLFAKALESVSKENAPLEYKYTRRGKLYRSENGSIFEYVNAGECDACEEHPKGKLEIKKTGEREYECVCTQNPKHVFDFDFTKK